MLPDSGPYWREIHRTGGMLEESSMWLQRVSFACADGTTAVKVLGDWLRVEDTTPSGQEHFTRVWRILNFGIGDERD